jgi:putative intracellular protease/amidase
MRSSRDRRGFIGTILAGIAALAFPFRAPARDTGPVSAPGSKGIVLVAGSNARILYLSDGHTAATGNYLNEMIVPMQALRAAGYDLLVATPDGSMPSIDDRSRSASHFGDDEAALRAANDFFDGDPSFHAVRSFRAVIDAGLDTVAGVFVPGGHAPITDLATNEELGEILRHAHATGKPTALICHGPIAALAAMPEADVFERAMIAGDRTGAAMAGRDWPYRGYRMTIFSQSEEAPVERDVFGARLLYPVADALALAGGNVGHGADYAPHVVTDRELITGQNPRSDHALAAQFVAALDARLPA